MITKAIWDYRIAADLVNATDPITIIDNLLDVVKHAKADGAEIDFCDELYFQTVNNITFCDWLYDKNSIPECADLKQELLKHLSKGRRIADSEYKEILSAIENKNTTGNLLISFHVSEDNLLYVFDIQRYLEAKQWYLSKYVSRDNFVDEAKTSFLNLFFHDNVSSSINTINADFRTIRPIIVKHLHALDDYHKEYSTTLNSGKGFREIAARIEELYSIECSPQSNRRGVQNLEYSFKNNATNNTETICCELHTKLKWKDMDRHNQDRIYFHPGKKDIENGKVLIVHIGTHI